MFIGEHLHTVDEKNRLSMPAKFRSGMEGGVVVTRGLDKCLFVYTKEEWKLLTEKVMQLPLTQQDARSFARFLFAGAVDVELDRSGRMLLPEYLKEYAGITKDATVLGVMNHVEIWDAAEWKSYRQKTEQNATAIAEQITKLGV